MQEGLCFQEHRDESHSAEARHPVVDQARATKAADSKKLVEDYVADQGCFS